MEFTLAHHKENEGQFHTQQGQGLLSQEMTNKMETISNAHMCRKAVDFEFCYSGGVSAEFYGWTAKTANIGGAIRQFPNPQSFLTWKTRFKDQVTTCSDFPSEATVWIKEVETVDSFEELKCSRSDSGENFPNFEMLDAKTACACH